MPDKSYMLAVTSGIQVLPNMYALMPVLQLLYACKYVQYIAHMHALYHQAKAPTEVLCCYISSKVMYTYNYIRD